MGSRGGAPTGLWGSPPEADDFSQLKGYLDVLWRDLESPLASWGHGPLAPLKSASGQVERNLHAKTQLD